MHGQLVAPDPTRKVAAKRKCHEHLYKEVRFDDPGFAQIPSGVASH